MLRTPLPCRKLISLVCLSFIIQFCSGGKKERIGIDLPKLEETSLHHSNRQSKNLFPFVWVTFQPSPCGNNNPNDGVCVQRGKCPKKGGTANGNCQDGFGDCCTFTEQCNENRTQIDVNQLVTTLKSPSPVNVNSQCSFRFRKEPNICQIRLDFVSVQMTSANPDGICESDKLRISNSITVPNDFTTCGTLNGQHMYLTFGSQDTIEVTPILRSVSSSYSIVATRIPCDSNRRVPDYCLQHYTASTGMVKSFDFNRQQQSNQQYTVCVKPMPQSTGVKWMPCGMTTNPFDITSNFNAAPLTCTKDWIQVKGGDKICETFVQTTSTWKPYDLLVNFDATEFPRPPDTFSKPITGPCSPTNCPPIIDALLTCECIAEVPAPNTCQCSLDLTMIPGTDATPDFNNTGFCLEYNQL